jgi:membrane protease YdiL (CAAX protease family)
MPRRPASETASAEQARAERRAAARELGVLGGVLAVTLALTAACRLVAGVPGQLASVLVPPVWLLAGSAWWWRARPPSLSPCRGGRRVWLPATLTIALGAAVVAMAVCGPGAGVRATAVAPARAAALVHALALALLVPVAEEAFFRGLLLAHFSGPLGRPGAVLLVSGAFGLLHVPQGTGLLMAGLSALLCGLALGTESLLWPVLVHAGYNALAVVYAMPAGPIRLGSAAALALLLLLATGWGIGSRSVRRK